MNKNTILVWRILTGLCGLAFVGSFLVFAQTFQKPSVPAMIVMVLSYFLSPLLIFLRSLALFFPLKEALTLSLYGFFVPGLMPIIAAFAPNWISGQAANIRTYKTKNPLSPTDALRLITLCADFNKQMASLNSACNPEIVDLLLDQLKGDPADIDIAEGMTRLSHPVYVTYMNSTLKTASPLAARWLTYTLQKISSN